eukprot:6558876-Pyramimonas_sp.AAC.1
MHWSSMRPHVNVNLPGVVPETHIVLKPDDRARGGDRADEVPDDWDRQLALFPEDPDKVPDINQI